MKQIFSLPAAAAETLNHHTATTRPASLIFCSSLSLTYQRTSTNASERQRRTAKDSERQRRTTNVSEPSTALVFIVVRCQTDGDLRWFGPFRRVACANRLVLSPGGDLQKIGTSPHTSSICRLLS